jgi:hypothetical protein
MGLGRYLPDRVTFDDPDAAKATARRDNRRPDPAAGERYAAQLALETERSLRRSSPWWCPESCLIHPKNPWACSHGQPLADRERWRGITYNGSTAGRADLEVAR